MHANHHCFRKFGYADKLNSTELRAYHGYTLCGIARIDACGLDIYKYFFNSPFTKNKEYLEANRVSMFFQAFSQLFIMKSLFYRNPAKKLDEEVKSIIHQDLFNLDQLQKMEGEADKQYQVLVKQTKKIANYIEKQYQQVLNKSGKSQQDVKAGFFQYATALDQQISTFLSNFMVKLKANMLQVMQNEHIPESFPEDTVFLYIKTNLQSINRIQIMRKQQRKALIKQMDYLSHVIGLKFPQQKKTQKKSQKAAKKVMGEIVVHNFSIQREPILISLADQAMHRKGIFKSRQESQTWGTLVQKLVLAFCQFHKDSGRCLPKITASDVYFDQRSLKVGLLYDKIILEALGMLDPAIMSMQAKLVFGPTPTTNDEDCYLQDMPENQWKMRKKYYLKPQQDEDDRLLELQEKIHVWRIVDLIFYLNTRQHLAQHYFRKQNPGILFDIGEFKKARKKVYDYIAEYKEQIWSIFPSSYMEIDQRQSSTFNFSLLQLRSMVGKSQQDSFLKGLSLTRTWRQLSWRKELFQQMHWWLMGELFFTKLKNPKKYIILLLLDYLQQSNYLRVLSQHSQGDKEDCQLNQDYNKRNQRIKKVYEKLEDYTKGENHQHKRYIEDSSLKPSMGQLAALNRKWMKVALDDERLRNEQIKVADLKGLIWQTGRQEAIKQSLQLIQTIKWRIEQKGSEVMREAKQMAASFMQKDLCKELLENPENAHKKPERQDDNQWRSYVKYLSRKLSATIVVLLSLNSDNWLRYRGLCRSVLISKFSNDYEEVKRNGEREMELRNGRLAFIQQWLADELRKDRQLEILCNTYSSRRYVV